MNKLIVFLILGLLAILAILGAPAVAQPAIMIYFDNDGCPTYARDKPNGGNGNAKPCPATGTRHSDAACRLPGDTVVWKSTANQQFSILDFPYSVTYSLGNKQAEASIPTGIGNVEIKYTISNASCTCVLDPRLIIGNTFFMLNLDERVQPLPRAYPTE
jgi:hypothetical protein